jgi:uncharacterized protein
MKRSILAVATLLSLLVALLVPGVIAPARAGTGPGAVAPQPLAPPSTGLTVVGTGSVTVTPDRAFLSVGVQSTAPSAAAAQTATNRTIATLLGALKALPAVQDVHTADISLYPQLPQDGKGTGPSQPSGFQAVHTLALTVKDTAKVGTVLDAAIKAGANTQVAVSFGLADPRPARTQALARAVADATSTAQQAARAAGLTLKGMTAMVVLPTSSETPSYAGLGGGGGTQIVPGSVEVDAAVQMTFAY